MNTELTQQSFNTIQKYAIITQIFHVPLEQSKCKESDQVMVCDGIRKKTGVHMECFWTKDQGLSIMVSGNVDRVMMAHREIVSQLHIQDSETLDIPKENHRFLIGRNGMKLQELESKTGTTIQIPGPDDPSNQIKISGTKEGLEKAKHEILLISAEQDKYAVRRVNIEKVYHPFITGAYNKLVGQIMQETGACIYVPPPNVNTTEIVITGQRQQVVLAMAKINTIFEDKKKRTTSIAVEVKKSQHKYVIGHRGKTLQEILDKTGVSVEIPPLDSGSEMVILRGEPGRLVQALTEVYVKTLRRFEQTITVDPMYYPRIIGRKGETVKAICAEHDVNIKFPERNQDQITITGYESNTTAARDAIQAIVDEVRDRISEDITLDSGVHSRIIGAQGSGIKRLMNELKVDIRFPGRGAAEPNRVTVTGRAKLVDEAINRLIKLEDKYMEDDELKLYLRPPRRSTVVMHEERGPSNGCVVRQAPRTTTNAKAPDMSCFEDFPSIGSAVATKTKR